MKKEYINPEITVKALRVFGCNILNSSLTDVQTNLEEDEQLDYVGAGDEEGRWRTRDTT